MSNILKEWGPKTLVSDNAPEFCDGGLCTWMSKIGCYKIPPYHPQSNGIAKRVIRTLKMGLKVFESYRDTIKTYLPKLLMSYRSIPHAGKVQSPFALMKRQIRTPITMTFTTNEKMGYKKSKEADPEEANFIMQKGNNTAMIHMGNRNVLAHASQVRNRIEDVYMEEPKVDDGLNLCEGDWLEEHMEENVAESDTQYDESNEDEIRSHSLSCSTPPWIFRRSDWKTKGIRHLHFGRCCDITNGNVSQ